MTITITEEFDDTLGRFLDYDTNDTMENTIVGNRKHIDIRLFLDEIFWLPDDMLFLAQIMNDLDPLDMQDLEGSEAFIFEPWTNTNPLYRYYYVMYTLEVPMSTLNTLTMADMEGSTGNTPPVVVTGADTANDLRNTLHMTCLTGVNSTTSGPISVDLSALAPTDVISLALPNYPGNNINKNSSYLEFRQGLNFVHLPFSGLPTIAGNTEASWPISDLGNLTKFDTVTFHIVATGSCVFTVAKMRAIASGWLPIKLDIDTRTQRLTQTVNLNGSVPSNGFPKLWKSTLVPFDTDLFSIFQTGDMSSENALTLFLRGRNESRYTQADYEGVPQSDLDILNQSEFEQHLPASSEVWIDVKLEFGTTNAITVGKTDVTSIIFDNYVLIPHRIYIFSVTLEDSQMRIRINLLDENETIGLSVFDSGLIRDESIFIRSKGRVGYQADLGNGDTWIENIRTKHLVFGELISGSFESITPVEGARIYVAATADTDSIPNTSAFGDSILSADVYNLQSSDGSLKIKLTPLTGITTSWINFEDFQNSEIVFDLFYPAAAISENDRLVAGLINRRGYVHPIPLPRMLGNQWQTIKIPVTSAFKYHPTGNYKFILIQTSGSYTWNVDNLFMRKRSVAWSGRSSFDDPWNRDQELWTEFRDLVNSETNGVVFPERGQYLQIRGQSLTQEAKIDNIYIKPKYSELGRLVWNDD